MNIKIDSKLRLKSGEDVIVTSIPNYNKFYCRTLNGGEFKVVMRGDIEYVHPTAPTLF